MIAALLCLCAALIADDGTRKVASVNGAPILARDVELELLLEGKKAPSATDREAATNRVIDRALVAKFLTKHSVKPLEEDVENLVERTRAGVQSGGETLDVVLKRLNLTEDDLRKSARAAVIWESYVLRTATQKELQTLFDSHREQYDGTQVRLKQIVRSLPTDAPAEDWEAAVSLLKEIRTEIAAAKLEFAAAAMKHSTSPSGKSGGEIGFVRYQGDVPAPVAAAAFALKAGELSEPIRSPVGVHLIQVVERKPGDLSLEDARPALLRELGQQLWIKTVADLRAKAKVSVTP
jgi:parvulin-like peptidyl-prolyl isomerase